MPVDWSTVEKLERELAEVRADLAALQKRVDELQAPKSPVAATLAAPAPASVAAGEE